MAARDPGAALMGAHELVGCTLRCSACGGYHDIALPADEPIRAVLAGVSCPSCGRLGRMRLARNATATSYDEPPDKEGDEPLRELRAKFLRRPAP
jgi:hypothetical protein